MAKQDHGHDLVRVRAVANLDAHGHSRQQIASELGISVPTVQRAKAHPDYETMRATAAIRGGDSLRPLIDKVSTDVLNGMSKAVKTLLDQLDAEDAEGNPLYGVRQAAAKELMAAGVKLLPSGGGAVAGPAGGQGAGAGRTSITFNINPDGTVKVDAESTAEDDDPE